MTPRSSSAALVAVCALAACAHAPATPAPATPLADYFPLAVGNEWVYRDESPALSPERQGSTRTVRILDRTADGYFRDNERGELRWDADCLRDRARRLLCAPLAPGSSWTSVVSVSSTERYEIVGVSESVTTPAGRFDGCVKVRAHNRASPSTDHILEITYAAGVGPVRLETFVVVDGRATPQIRAVLERYQVARQERGERPTALRQAQGERPTALRQAQGERPTALRQAQGERPTALRQAQGERPTGGF